MSQPNGNPATGRAAGPRCVAILGPFASGKTTLFEAILERTGAIPKAGSVTAGTSVGDRSKEARAHQMGVELNVADVTFMGDRYTFIDCPGSVEFAHESEAVLAVADLAVVVCEADEKKIPALQLILKKLEDEKVPHVLFLNKIDRADQSLRETLALMQTASSVPMVLRQIPIWKNGVAIGTIDLARERAHVFRDHAESEVIDIPDHDKADEVAARYQMLEKLADYDDHLMEELLTDVAPPRDEVFDDLKREMREGLIMPVFIGCAERGNGVSRLLKAIRHEAPGIAETRARLGLKDQADAVVQVFKTWHMPHAGKLSLSRILTGKISDGTVLTASNGASNRVSGLYDAGVREHAKIAEAGAGMVVGIGKCDAAVTGDTLTSGKVPVRALAAPSPTPPVMALAVSPKEAKDDVKLSTALQRIVDEDPSLHVVQDAEMRETRLEGQGEMHLRVAVEKIQNRFGVAVGHKDPGIPYRETIKGSTTIRGRHKKQSGGHGQYGDIVVTIAPEPRGAGFRFAETVTGGAVPRNYFGAIEDGIRETLSSGALGFPLVDLSVTLTDGSYHTVDSSDQAFKTAAHVAMREGLPQCAPVLLEPILKVVFRAPSEATARVNQIVTGRRGQLLGFDGRGGWAGWDEVSALIPQAEMGRLIVELRSATSGVGTFEANFDHLAEVAEPQAVKIAEARRAAKAAG